MEPRAFISRRRLLAAGAGFAAGHALGAGGVDDTLQAGADVPGLRALLAARRGELIAERYCGGATADSLQPIRCSARCRARYPFALDR